MTKWLLLFCFLLPSIGKSEDLQRDVAGVETDWKTYSRKVDKMEAQDRRNGISYIISGVLAFAGGIAGTTVTDDALEDGVYTIFQSIGVASIGYGAYTWQVGGDERALRDTLVGASSLSDIEKTNVLTSYFANKRERLKSERFIKAITHGLVAGLNIYNGSVQENDSIRNTLFFIGGINGLAAISYSF